MKLIDASNSGLVQTGRRPMVRPVEYGWLTEAEIREKYPQIHAAHGHAWFTMIWQKGYVGSRVEQRGVVVNSRHGRNNGKPIMRRVFDERQLIAYWRCRGALDRLIERHREENRYDG